MEAIAPHRRLAGRYVLEEAIAAGGMATVWRAKDEVLARPVAMKILREDLARDPDFLERFRREAVSAARLTHPSIVSVFDTGIEDDVCYIVMEDLGGSTLRELMDEAGPLPAPRAVELITPILSALGFAHSNGLIHRDVKPANVLISPDGRVKVTDFGIARAAFAGGDITTTGQVLGTVRYLSPEQVQGGDVDGRSDVYSTGVVLYEMLSGRAPFVAESDVATAMMRLTSKPLPPRAIRPDIPRRVEAVVMKAMATRPDERFPTAEAMAAALHLQVGAEDPMATQRIHLRPQEPERSSSLFRSWMLVPLIVLLLAGTVIAVGLTVGRLGLGGPFDEGEEPQASPRAGRPSGVELPVRQARDFDPEGDGAERPEEVGGAIDGNPDSSWETEGYNSASLGGLKQGVGLWLDLGGVQRVSRIVISSPLSGWQFELKEGPFERPSQALTGLSGRSSFTVGDGGRISVGLQSVETEGLLIWITELAPDGGRFRAAIEEVTVVGTAP